MPATFTTPEVDFLARAHAGQNVFLTGMAGTGKSYLLRQFIRESGDGTRNGELSLAGDAGDTRRIDVTAPTGVAALNIGGMTVHRWSGILLGPRPGESNEAAAARLDGDSRPSLLAAKRRVHRAVCLVIDEISMLPGRHFDFLNFWLKRLRANQRPFGGCQLVVVGDFLQLPPVRLNEREPYDWAFACAAWREAGLQTVLLETVRRQDEPAFVRALSNFRRGDINGEGGKLLRSRVVTFPKADLTRIFTRNDAVDKWNAVMLDEIPEVEFEYQAETTGSEAQLDYLCKNLLTPRVLKLKPGAKVMFTRNDRQRRWVNGTVGKVLHCEPNEVDVEADGTRLHVQRETWCYDDTEPDAAQFIQFPLRLAYAVTIHKSQGCTLDAAYMDIRAAREPGQAYVAISRVRTLAGLNLKEWPKGIWVSKEAMKFYEPTR